jgi:hypothetical protein
MIVLAIYGVQDDLKLTDAQKHQFVVAMLAWWKRHKMWPDGF